MAVAGELMIRAGIDIADVITGTAAIAKEMEGVSNVVDRQLGSLDKLSARWQEVGTTLTTYVTLPFAAISAAVIKASVDFDEASDRIRARTGAIGDDLAGMGETFKSVFSSIPTSASDASEAISGLVQRLNISGEPLKELATQELNLARITETSIGPLIASTTRLFGDWSISTEKQSGALDYLYKVTQTSGIGIGKLTDLIVQFGAPMRALGLDMEHAAVLLGKWEKEGVNITTVLSGMRMELARMAKAGIDTSAGFGAIIDSIKNAKSETEALTMSVKIFGQRAAVDMFRAIKEGRFDVDEWVNSLKASTETINGVAEATLSFSDKLVLLKNKIETALEPIGTVLTGMFEHAMDGSGPILDFIQSISEGFAKLSPTTQEWIVGLVAAGAAIGPLAIGAAAIVTGFTAVTAALAPVAAGIAGFLVSMSGISAAAIEADAALGATAIGIGAVTTALTVGAAAFAGWQIGGLVNEVIDLGSNLVILKEQFFGTTDVMSIFANKEEECGLQGGLMNNALEYTAKLLSSAGKAAAEWHWSDYINPLATFTKLLNDTNKEIAEYIAKSTIAWKDAPNGINAVTDQMRKQADAVMKTDAANKALAETNERASQRAKQLAVDLAGITAGHEKAEKATRVHAQSLDQWYISANKFLEQTTGNKGLAYQTELFGENLLLLGDRSAYVQLQFDKMAAAIGNFGGWFPPIAKSTADALRAIEIAASPLAATFQEVSDALKRLGVETDQSLIAQMLAVRESLALVNSNIFTSLREREDATIAANDRLIALWRKMGIEVTDAEIDTQRKLKAIRDQANIDIEQADRILGVNATRSIQDRANLAVAAYEKLKSSSLSTQQDILKGEAAMYQAQLEAQQAHGVKITESQKRQLDDMVRIAREGHKTLLTQWDLFANQLGDSITKSLDTEILNVMMGKFSSLKDILKSLWQDIAKSFETSLIHPLTEQFGKWVAKTLLDFTGLGDAAKKAGEAIKSGLGLATGAGEAASGAGGAAGSASGAVSGAASGLGSLSSILSIAGIGVNVASGITAGIQAAHANSLLDKIEKSTREISVVMWQNGAQSVIGILQNTWTNSIKIHDRLVDLRDALFSPVAQAIEAIDNTLKTLILPALRGVSTATTDSADQTNAQADENTQSLAEQIQAGIDANNAQANEALAVANGIAGAANLTADEVAGLQALSEQTASATTATAEATTNLAGTVTQSGGEIINALGQTGSAIVQAQLTSADAMLAQLAAIGDTWSNSYTDFKAEIKGVSSQSLADQKAAYDKLAAQIAAAASIGKSPLELAGLVNYDPVIARTGGDNSNLFKGAASYNLNAPLAGINVPVGNPVTSPGITYTPNYGYVAPSPYTSAPAGSAGFSRTSTAPVRYASQGNAVNVNIYGNVTGYDEAQKMMAAASEEITRATR